VEDQLAALDLARLNVGLTMELRACWVGCMAC
jgi:hypothetical protein